MGLNSQRIWRQVEFFGQFLTSNDASPPFSVKITLKEIAVAALQGFQTVFQTLIFYFKHLCRTGSWRWDGVYLFSFIAKVFTMNVFHKGKATAWCIRIGCDN